MGPRPSQESDSNADEQLNLHMTVQTWHLLGLLLETLPDVHAQEEKGA